MRRGVQTKARTDERIIPRKVRRRVFKQAPCEIGNRFNNDLNVKMHNLPLSLLSKFALSNPLILHKS